MSNNLVNIVPYILPFENCCQTEDNDTSIKFKCLSYTGFLDAFVRLINLLWKQTSFKKNSSKKDENYFICIDVKLNKETKKLSHFNIKCEPNLKNLLLNMSDLINQVRIKLSLYIYIKLHYDK